MASFQLIGQMPACLGNNLDTTFDKPLCLPVGLENLKWHIAQHRTNALNGLNNIRET